MPSVAEIAAFLSARWTGEDLPELCPSSLSSLAPGALAFLTRDDPELKQRLNATPRTACITTPEIAADLTCAVIAHPAPRLAFARVLERFFAPAAARGVSADATVAVGAELGDGVAIGPGSRIAADVSIGAGTVIGCNVVIGEGVVIGRRCVVKSNTTIGEAGFGFPLDENGTPVRFPHIGRVQIGDDVEIGANCTVVRAALDATVVEEHVKTDDHVHIAHNCVIGARTRLAAGVVLSGSVRIGRDVWVSPNATVIDYVSIGDGAFVGIGSVVTKPVDAGLRVFGVPARAISRAP